MESRTGCALGVAGLLVSIVAAVAAFGGPEEAWLRLRWIWAGHPPPIIVNLEPDPDGPKGSYIATLRNPSWEDVAVTGYEASTWELATSMSQVDDGGVTVMHPKEPPPEDCKGTRRVPLPQPLDIQPKGLRGIHIRPWNKDCWFDVHFTSDHGDTEPRMVAGSLRLKDLDALKRLPPTRPPPPPPPQPER